MPKNIGYKTKLQYQEPKENDQNKKKGKRNIIWFNPLYSRSVKTNIGRIFLKLISKHFLPNHKFVTIFNKDTIKPSYFCMPNIRSKINGNNKIILHSKPTEPQKSCNCLVKEDCQINGLCLTSNILYQDTIKCNARKYEQKRYKGIYETILNDYNDPRYANHKKLFNLLIKCRELDFKTKTTSPRLTREIKGQCKAYNPTLKNLNLA